MREKDSRDRELDEEIASHLRMAAQDRLEQGASREQAESEARREMGNAGLIKEVTREQDGWRGLERLMQDVRFGLRMLRKNPAFTAISVLTLALGIGASTSIFSVVYGVLLRPLPYYKADQLVQISEQRNDGNIMDVADPNFEDLRSQNNTLQGLAEFGYQIESVSGGSEPKRLTLGIVSRDFFSIMGVQPFRGRSFLAEEQRQNAAPTVLVSYSFWRDELGGREDFAKLRLKVGDYLAAVIGVLPPGFHFPGDADLWVPRELFDVLPARDAHNWKVIGRLKDGVALDRAHAELSGIAQRLKQQYGDQTAMSSVAVVPLREALTGKVSSTMWILLGAVGFLLLVACANVMNLLLAQAAARDGELATRAALGASRARLIRQFLVESLLLCFAGGILGVAAAEFGLRALVMLAPSNIPRLGEVSVNLPVLLFALGICCLVAVSLGTVTAFRATAGNIQTALVEGNRRQAGASQGIGRWIIAMQLGITMILLIGAGLLGRSLQRVLSVDPGFRTEQIITVDLALPDVSVAARAHRVEFLDKLVSRLRSLPGVVQASGINAMPLDGNGLPDGIFAVINEAQLSAHDRNLIQSSAKPDGEAYMKEMIAFLDQYFHNPSVTGDADYAVVGPEYFSTMGIPLLRGRTIEESDGPESTHVAVISESVARQRWPNEDAIGRTIEFGNMDGDLRLLHVVGVVADVRERSLERSARPTIYASYRQRPQSTSHFVAVIRAGGSEASLIPAARRIVAELDPSVPPKISTFRQVFALSLIPRRFNLTLIATFALTALALAMIGIYGVLAYSVARRTREMGVRIALGATRGNVLKLVLKQAVVTAAIGVGVGIVGAFGLTRLLQSMLFGVKATDPVTFAAVTFLLLAVAALAAYLPARRATRVDPIIALRYE